MRKKILICIISIVVIIGIVLVINVNKNNKKYSYEVEKLGNENYFLLMQNNKYGVIDRAGNIIIDPTFDIIEMPNPSKDIFICKGNYNENKKEYNVQVFNKNKEPILYQYYIVEAIELNSVEDNGFYEKSVLKYKSDGLYGLIDLSGNKITKPVYESIEGFEYNEGLLLVKKSGKYGIINMNGAIIVKPKYDEILSDGYYEEQVGYKKSGYIVGKKSDDGMRYGYIDSNRKELLKSEFNDIYRIADKKDSTYLVAFKDGKAGIYKKNKNVLPHDYEDIEYNEQNDSLTLQKASKQGVTRFDGSIIVPYNYDNIFFAGNYINAKNENGVDIFDSNGNKEQNSEYVSKKDFCDNSYEIVSTSNDEYKIIVNKNGKLIEDKYSFAQYLFDKYFIVKKDDLFGIIDDEGNIVIDCKYEEIQPTTEYNIVQLRSKDGTIILLNRKLEELVKSSNASITFLKDYLKFSKSDSVVYINKNGELVQNTDVYKNNKLISYNEKNKWGFKDKEGNVVIEAKYNKITEFNEYGFAGIKLNDMWGVIDEQGNIVKEPTYKLLDDPEFIKEYYKVDLGYGSSYYTDKND